MNLWSVLMANYNKEANALSDIAIRAHITAAHVRTQLHNESESKL